MSVLVCGDCSGLVGIDADGNVFAHQRRPVGNTMMDPTLEQCPGSGISAKLIEGADIAAAVVIRG